jgi:hypothetical protein
MRSLSILSFVAGVALVLGAALAQGGLAVFTGQATVTGNTFTTDPCFPNNDTGFLNATAQAADTGGDGDGFELNPTNAFADGGGNATNADGAADDHRFYNYGIPIDSTCVITGIQVRLDWWLDSTAGINSMSADLSWDGGTTWTTAKTDTVESTTELTATLGGAADTWSHSWTVAELSNANFRVRLTSNSDDALRDFFLDWVPVKVYYGP